jgi:hypothetical protein
VGERLWSTAQARLACLVDFFSEFRKTFLGAWTDGGLGIATPYVPMAKPSFRQAVDEIRNAPPPDFSKERAQPADDLRSCITILVEDFLDYIEYTHVWREIVYTVRTHITRSRLPGERPLPFQLT